MPPLMPTVSKEIVMKEMKRDERQYTLLIGILIEMAKSKGEFPNHPVREIDGVELARYVMPPLCLEIIL